MLRNNILEAILPVLNMDYYACVLSNLNKEIILKFWWKITGRECRRLGFELIALGKSVFNK